MEYRKILKKGVKLVGVLKSLFDIPCFNNLRRIGLVARAEGELLKNMGYYLSLVSDKVVRMLGTVNTMEDTLEAEWEYLTKKVGFVKIPGGTLEIVSQLSEMICTLFAETQKNTPAALRATTFDEGLAQIENLRRMSRAVLDFAMKMKSELEDSIVLPLRKPVHKLVNQLIHNASTRDPLVPVLLTSAPKSAELSFTLLVDPDLGERLGLLPLFFGGPFRGEKEDTELSGSEDAYAVIIAPSECLFAPDWSEADVETFSENLASDLSTEMIRFVASSSRNLPKAKDRFFHEVRDWVTDSEELSAPQAHSPGCRKSLGRMLVNAKGLALFVIKQILQQSRGVEGNQPDDLNRVLLRQFEFAADLCTKVIDLHGAESLPDLVFLFSLCPVFFPWRSSLLFSVGYLFAEARNCLDRPHEESVRSQFPRTRTPSAPH